MSKVSLKSLSQHLGLAEGTVSRAINGYPDISERTRERVRRAVVELGYRPNSNARRLATGNAECVGYVLPWRQGHISDPFLGEMLDGLSAALAERHWDLTISVPRSEEDELAIITRLAESGRVNGIVLSRTLIRDRRVECVRALGIPFVTHGRTGNSDDHAWFDIDNFAAFREAVHHLAGLGHARIACIHGRLDYNFATQRWMGFQQGLKDCGLELVPGYKAQSKMNQDGGSWAMMDLMQLKRPPTAVVCVSDLVAVGAMKAIREAGMRPGREISVIGYDGLLLGEHTDPPLTTMAYPVHETGRTIGEMLLAAIDGAKPSDNQQLRRAELLRRESDGPPPAA
ncbi:MAG: substrate-binding domain-containing protein [Rhodobiaceae bacterium]|nr:substrate-binding domain-containing protein [Rhodobiaceae bacterium]